MNSLAMQTDKGTWENNCFATRATCSQPEGHGYLSPGKPRKPSLYGPMSRYGQRRNLPILSLEHLSSPEVAFSTDHLQSILERLVDANEYSNCEKPAQLPPARLVESEEEALKPSVQSRLTETWLTYVPPAENPSTPSISNESTPETNSRDEFCDDRSAENGSDQEADVSPCRTTLKTIPEGKPEPDVPGEEERLAAKIDVSAAKPPVWRGRQPQRKVEGRRVDHRTATSGLRPCAGTSDAGEASDSGQGCLNGGAESGRRGVKRGRDQVESEYWLRSQDHISAPKRSRRTRYWLRPLKSARHLM